MKERSSSLASASNDNVKLTPTSALHSSSGEPSHFALRPFTRSDGPNTGEPRTSSYSAKGSLEEYKSKVNVKL